MSLRYGRFLWLDRNRSAPPPQFPEHTGHLDLDVAIVGGGFTGCLTAYVLASAGLKVAVFERSRIGSGSTLASTALLIHTPDRYFVELASLYGRRTAQTIWRLSRRSVRDLIGILEPLDCGVRRVPSFYLSTDASGAADLRRDHAARRTAGLDGRLLTSDGVRKATGVRGTAAIRLSGDAVVDPSRATMALAAAASRAGARVFERSDVLQLAGQRDGARLDTPRGTATCAYAIIATGFATPVFKPLQARFTMSTTYVIATEPIAPRDRSRMGNGRVMFWDANRPYHYLRWTDDDRILFGGEDRPVPRTARARRSALVKSARSLRQTLLDFYPALTPPRIEYAWDGLFAATPDGLPYIGPHRRYPRQLFALGYGGNGMAFGSLAARILLRYCLGRPLPTDALFGFARRGAKTR